MPDQPKNPDMSILDRVSAVWKTAAAAGFSLDKFFEVIEAAVAAAIRDSAHGRLGWMLSSDDPEVRERLGYTAFVLGDDLYAVRMIAGVGDDVVYRVVQLAEQGVDDTEVATLTVDGIHDAASVRTRALDAVKRVTELATTSVSSPAMLISPARIEELAVAGVGYVAFRHHDGHAYVIRKVSFSGPNLVCTVSQVATQPDGAEVSLREAESAIEVGMFEVESRLAGRESLLQLAYSEVTRGNLVASLKSLAPPVSFAIRPTTTTNKEADTDA